MPNSFGLSSQNFCSIKLNGQIFDLGLENYREKIVSLVKKFSSRTGHGNTQKDFDSLNLHFFTFKKFCQKSLSIKMNEEHLEFYTDSDNSILLEKQIKTRSEGITQMGNMMEHLKINIISGGGSNTSKDQEKILGSMTAEQKLSFMQS